MINSKQTYTFKVVNGCKIKADVYAASDAVKRPVVVWIHGGALIAGHRGNISPTQIDLYVNAGYTLVSIDYRLAPETKLKAIVEDIRDAYAWVHEKGYQLFNIDPDRIAIIGHSAGGYLALMAGFCVDPRPKALVSFYGYGDITGKWYSRPDPFYCQQPPVPKEEAYAAVGVPIISEAAGQHNRHRFYLYCRQQGLWPKEVTGHDPNTEPMAFNLFCPIRNITREYPSTLLLHGDRDTDVPYKQSLMMASELAFAGVQHELITIPSGEHGFDRNIKDPLVALVFGRVIAFLKKHLS